MDWMVLDYRSEFVGWVHTDENDYNLAWSLASQKFGRKCDYIQAIKPR